MGGIARTRLMVWATYKPPAYQYKAVPQIANAQPNTQASSSQPVSLEPSSTSGNAYSRLKVAVLPKKCTGSEENPLVLRTGISEAIMTSRPTTSATSHHGMIS